MDNKGAKRIGQNIKIKKYEDIFNSLENASDSSDKMIFINPALLKDFNNHPFKVEGKGIDQLMESIREQGILSPVIVRSVNREYEIISGHRRKYCALKLGLTQVPIIIRQADDDEAILEMVSSNIQREYILPSEKAFAYKMQLEAIKRQGERGDLTNRNSRNQLTSGQIVRKFDSADIIGNENNKSGRQIRRYIRLTELPATFIDAIDNKKMSFNAGVELSFLSENQKKAVEKALTKTKCFPSLIQAKKLRAKAGTELTEEDAIIILTDNKNKNDPVNFERKDIKSFFPEEYTARQIEEAIIQILKEREYKK